MILQYINTLENNDDINNRDPYKDIPNIRRLVTRIDDIESNRSNRISLEVLKSIKDKCEDTLVQTADNINYYTGNMIASQVVENDKLSNMMTSMFTDTKVKVYIYFSSTIDAYTMPGINTLATPFLQKIRLLFSSLPIKAICFISSIYATFFLTLSNLFYSFLSILEQCINGIKSNSNNNTIDQLSYNPNTKKFTISQKEVTIYLSSNLIKYINNDNELKAILLHEIGHNVKLTYSIVENILESTWLATLLSSAYFYILNDQQKDLLYSTNSSDNIDIQYNNYHEKAVTLLITSIFVLIFFMYISAYLSRKQEIYSDEFAIKCGYGKYLYSAIRKLHTLFDEYNILENMNRKKGFIKSNYFTYEKTLKYISTMLRYLERYPSREDRESMIKNKTKYYDTSSNNIDRSGNIDNY